MSKFAIGKKSFRGYRLWCDEPCDEIIKKINCFLLVLSIIKLFLGQKLGKFTITLEWCCDFWLSHSVTPILQGTLKSESKSSFKWMLWTSTPLESMLGWERWASCWAMGERMITGMFCRKKCLLTTYRRFARYVLPTLSNWQGQHILTW